MSTHCGHRTTRWVHDRALGAVIRTCVACGNELHIVGIEAWIDATRKVEP